MLASTWQQVRDANLPVVPILRFRVRLGLLMSPRQRETLFDRGLHDARH